MIISEYQLKALDTAIYPNKGNNVVYPTLGLVGEAGEIANKVKKIMRDNNGVITDEVKQKLSDELGDVLWYVAALSSELGLNMLTIAMQNLDKLHKRKTEGKLQGSGDNR